MAVTRKPKRRRILLLLFLPLLLGGIFAALLIFSGKPGAVPAKVTFVTWTNLPGGRHALLRVENISPHTIVLNQGRIYGDPSPHVRLIAFLEHPARRLDPAHQTVVEVPFSPSASEGLAVRLLGVRGQTIIEELASGVDELLTTISVRSEFIERLQDNSWQIEVTIPAHAPGNSFTHPLTSPNERE